MQRIIVAGAGLVGSLLAVYLAKKGYRVDVYDRNPDPRDASSDARAGKAFNLTLCDRGFKALDEVGVGNLIRSISVPAYGRFVHNEQGELAYQPYGNNAEALYSILRSDMSRAMVEFAAEQPNVEFHFDEKCVGLSLSPLEVEFKHMRTGAQRREKAYLLFGADGAFSGVRTHLQRFHRVSYAQEFLDQGYKELNVPATATAEWVSEKNVLHMWPRGRYMLLGFPNPDGSFTCSLHMPFEGSVSFASLQTESAVFDFFNEKFPDVVDHIPNLVEEFNRCAPNPMVTVKCSPWTLQGKVALIGDAAHVLYPYYGQGANAGFEDCAVLMECLEEFGDDWKTVFSEYEQLRKPNMDAISEMVVEHYVEIRDLLGDPKFLLRKALERKMNQLFPDRYLPLYSMIAFTTMPYVEALRIEREQRSMIDYLMNTPDIDQNWDSREVENIMTQLVMPVAVGAD
jgi:kynurenine 3-monooxygenase